MKIIFKMMFNFFQIFGLLIGFVLYFAFCAFLPPKEQLSVPFEDCGSIYNILHLNIPDCNSLPCKMVLGTTVTVNTIFDDGGRDTRFLKHEVRWILNSVRTNASITPDPCDSFENEECISNESIGKMYTATVFVNNTLPLVRGTLLWEVWDLYNVPVMCYTVPIKIVWNII